MYSCLHICVCVCVHVYECIHTHAHICIASSVMISIFDNVSLLKIGLLTVVGCVRAGVCVSVFHLRVNWKYPFIVGVFAFVRCAGRLSCWCLWNTHMQPRTKELEGEWEGEEEGWRVAGEHARFNTPTTLYTSHTHHLHTLD